MLICTYSYVHTYTFSCTCTQVLSKEAAHLYIHTCIHVHMHICIYTYRCTHTYAHTFPFELVHMYTHMYTRPCMYEGAQEWGNTFIHTWIYTCTSTHISYLYVYILTCTCSCVHINILTRPCMQVLNKEACLSNWEARPLSEKQLKYAALDAVREGMCMYISRYGVATISRLLKVIGLFWKRAL